MPLYYVSASCEQYLDNNSSQPVCYRRYAKKLGLEKMLTGHYETYSTALVLRTVNTTSFCIFISVYITRATVLCIFTLQIVSKFTRFQILVWLPEDGSRLYNRWEQVFG
jgi:hypothetical protein